MQDEGDLPRAAQDFPPVRGGREVGAPVCMISVGPERDQLQGEDRDLGS